MSEGVLFEQLKSSICTRDLTAFRTTLDEQTVAISLLKPRLVNEILLQCIKISSIDPVTYQSPTDDHSAAAAAVIVSTVPGRCSPPKHAALTNLTDGTEFIETFMFKMHPLKCYFMFSDETCKSVVKLFVAQNRQFSSCSINFLLRCYDLELIRQVFELDLVSQKCSGDCHDWHLMFVTSYHERFHTNQVETIFEGFLARFVLLCKLRCAFSQKRCFLTWFAGSLHLYTDECYLQHEESRFKYVLVELFESLILNGLLSNFDFINLWNMLAKRKEELVQINSSKYFSFSPLGTLGAYHHNQHNYQKKASLNLNSSNVNLNPSSSTNFPILDALFPLSLKNSCRLVIKRSMTKYAKSEIDRLPLPSNLKRFVFFENECEAVFKCFEQIKK